MRGLWTVGLLALALPPLAVIGCFAEPATSQTSPTARGAGSGPVAPEQATVTHGSGSDPSAARRAAMLTVYFYAHIEPGAEVPETVRPLPLLEAARILRADTGPFAESRRRRAIVKLAAADLERHRDALEILGAPLDAILAILDIQPPLTLPEREKQIFALMNAAGPAVPGCQPGMATTETEQGPNKLASHCPDPLNTAGVTKATSTITVPRPLSVIRQIMDPQSWDTCSEYFPKTHVAKQDPSGVYKIDSNTHEVDEDPAAPPPGSNWSGVLFEHFRLDWQQLSEDAWQKVFDELPAAWKLFLPTPPTMVVPAGESSFWNLLSINTQSGPDEYRVEYCLRMSIHGRIGLLPPLQFLESVGGIDVDEGHSEAATNPASGEVKLTGVKYIRFAGWFPPLSDVWLNVWAEVFLDAMGGELEESVCCALPGTPREDPPPGEPAPPILIQ